MLKFSSREELGNGSARDPGGILPLAHLFGYIAENPTLMQITRLGCGRLIFALRTYLR